MIGLWIAAALAGPGGGEGDASVPSSEAQARIVRAVSLARGQDGMFATEAEQAEAWREACRFGWRPACDPEAWEPTCPDDAATPAADPVGCLVLSWEALAAGAPPEAAQRPLRALCEAGWARACTDWGTVLVPRAPARAAALWEGACAEGEGLACRLKGATARACSLGDGLACVQQDDLPRACALGVPSACTAVAEARGGAAQGGGPVAEAYDRACALGDPRGCTGLGQILAVGRGIPADPDEGVRLLLEACRSDGEACRHLAEDVLAGRAPGLAVSARELYQRGCDLDDKESCRRQRFFDLEQRRRPVEFLGDSQLRVFLLPSVRPYLGGSVAFTSRLSVPRVDVRRARRHLHFVFDAGPGNATAGWQERDVPENHSMSALSWVQEGRPWGLQVGVGGLFWERAPDYLDTWGAWPLEPTDRYNLVAGLLRLDVSHETLLGAHTGVALSLAAIPSWLSKEGDGTIGGRGRITLSVARDTADAAAMPMRGARSELAGWVDGDPTAGQGAAGVVLTDVRALPLVRTASGREALSVVSDLLVAGRWGELPVWLAHHAMPRLSPNIGTWTPVRGVPAAFLHGDGLARGHLGLRWEIAEYHGRPRPLQLLASPWVELAGNVEELSRGTRGRWVSNAGLTAAVVYNRHTSLRAEAVAVPRAGEDPALLGMLVLEQALDPWD